MHYNQDRILTTHVGSLPRPASVESLLVKMEHGEGYDEAAMEQEISTAVAQSVMEQRDWGIDIVNDGEMSKTGYSTYIQQRRHRGSVPPCSHSSTQLQQFETLLQ